MALTNQLYSWKNVSACARKRERYEHWKRDRRIYRDKEREGAFEKEIDRKRSNRLRGREGRRKIEREREGQSVFECPTFIQKLWASEKTFSKSEKS